MMKKLNAHLKSRVPVIHKKLLEYRTSFSVAQRRTRPSPWPTAPTSAAQHCAKKKAFGFFKSNDSCRDRPLLHYGMKMQDDMLTLDTAENTNAKVLKVLYV